MGLSPTVRLRIGLCLVVTFALLSDARMVERAVHALPDMSRPDEITQHEARFQKLKQALPVDTAVGYVTDPKPQERTEDQQSARLAFKRYVLTQYALLPAIVFPDIHGSLVVGNFYSADGVDSEATRGLRLIRDFGDGVMLFGTSAE